MFTRKDLIKLIIPLIIEQTLAVSIGMADTVMVSSVGEAAVSGISLVDTINVFLINIFSALATGGAVISSQYIGRGDRDNACRAAKQLLYAILCVSLIIMIFSLIRRVWILKLIFGNIEMQVMENAKTYFFLSALSYPFLAIYNAGAALFRSMGNSKVSMFTSVLMNLINVAGNALLIFGFGLGVAGAGIATLISRITGAFIMMLLIKNPHNPLYIDRIFNLEFSWNMVRRILYIGIPNGMESGMFQFGKMLVQSLIASYGTTAIAANAVANNVASLQVIPGVAMGLAMIPVVGQCVGAKEFKQAKQYTLRLLAVAYVMMDIINIFVFLGASSIADFYNLSEQTSKTAIELMWCHGLGCIVFWPMSFTLPNALRAANDVKYPMIVSMTSVFLCRVLLSYVFGTILGLGVLGVWIAMVLDWVVRTAFFLPRFIWSHWEKRQLI